jgi:RNA polymerase sigma-70 factor (ECF subfamily)
MRAVGKDVQNVVELPGARAKGPLDHRTDDELMELAAANVRPAMEELVRRHDRTVRSYCRKWDPARGDDLAQDVFLRLWRARHAYRPRGRFRLYLFTLVRNRCRNALRDWFRRPAAQPLDTLEVNGMEQSQLEAVLEAERNHRVWREVASLPPKLREAVLLRFEQGLSHAEIAEIVGAPEVTVRSRVFLGLRRLRARLTAEVER